MTMDEFERELNAKADVFLAAAKQWADDCGNIGDMAENAGLPDHLVAASVSHVMKRIERECEE